MFREPLVPKTQCERRVAFGEFRRNRDRQICCTVCEIARAHGCASSSPTASADRFESSIEGVESAGLLSRTVQNVVQNL